MSFSDMTCTATFWSPLEEGQKEVLFVPRVLLVCLGAIAALGGVLVFCKIPGLHSLGTIGGSSLIGGGVALSLAALCVRCVERKQPSSQGQEQVTAQGSLPLAAPAVDYVESEKLSADLQDMVHELCELDQDGRSRPCTFERLSAIVKTLKDANNLHVLNTIPTGGYRAPLQHWAQKGDLAAVKLLVEHGAMDYCHRYDVSALYVAVLFGQSEIVEYLLAQGATAAVAFHENALYFFIPQFIFHIDSLNASYEFKPGTLACLRRVLEDLQQKDPDNLKLQLQIPIGFRYDLDKETNALDWPSEENFPPDFLALLREFGAQTGQCLSAEELKTRGYNVGRGFTLRESASLK